jgi:hypothetical protein
VGGACGGNVGEVESFRVLAGERNGERPLERPSYRWVDNIKMDLLEIGLSELD